MAICEMCGEDHAIEPVFGDAHRIHARFVEVLNEEFKGEKFADVLLAYLFGLKALRRQPEMPKPYPEIVMALFLAGELIIEAARDEREAKLKENQSPVEQGREALSKLEQWLPAKDSKPQ